MDDLYLLLVVPALLFSVYASLRVRHAFSKYSRMTLESRLTGEQAARAVLESNGVTDVVIEMIPGKLNDHFDPRSNTIRLSQDVFGVASAAAAGVAAHEAGHAVQYAAAYTPIKVRAAIIPITNIGSTLAYPMVLVGFMLNMMGLVNLGILLFGCVVVFQLITLPVEYDASRRGSRALAGLGVLSGDEIHGARKVLSAAALTYVGALAVSLAQLIRLIVISRRRD